MEKSVQEELLKVKASKDGDVECNPSWWNQLTVIMNPCIIVL